MNLHGFVCYSFRCGLRFWLLAIPPQRSLSSNTSHFSCKKHFLYNYFSVFLSISIFISLYFYCLQHFFHYNSYYFQLQYFIGNYKNQIELSHKLAINCMQRNWLQTVSWHANHCGTVGRTCLHGKYWNVSLVLYLRTYLVIISPSG